MSKFKVGDWVKCTDPVDILYGKTLLIVEASILPFRYKLKENGTNTVWWCAAQSMSSFVLTPAPSVQTQTFTAPDILRKAEEIMRERGKQYDQQGGERSMEKIVNTFNSATGHNLTEAQGWMFMIFLKLVRDNSRTEGHQDSCEDLVAYSSLYGESRLS